MANAKLDVDIASFVSDINTAKGVLKGLNAEMKAADAEFKATGNSEQQLTAKTKTLNSQIRMQKSIVDNAKNALKAMDAEGIDPADASYQRLYATMMNANAGMNEAQAQLNALGSSAQEAATGADQLTSSVNKIGKKISLDQVISGIDKITTGLSNAAKKAVELGKELWNNVMDSAALSDDILTQATILDMTPEQYQQYKGVFDTIAEVTVKDWMNAKRKVEKAMNDPTNDQMDALKALGLGRFVDKYGVVRTQEIADNWEDGLWRIAGELQKRVSSGEISMEMADVYGEALFGKNFSALKPLFDLGKEGFIAALGDQATISDEALKKNAELNDQMIKLKASFDALQAEVTSALAPALTDAAKALDGLLAQVLEYLQKPEGQKMLEDIGTAVSGLFDDLGKIDPDDVVSGFTEVFNTVVGSVQWLTNNWEDVVSAMKGIVIGWGALELTGGALKIANLINGLRGLTGAGAAAAAGQAGASVGASWGAGFASAVLKAAPWLALFAFAADTIKNDIEGQAADQVKAGERRSDYIDTASKVLGTGDESLMAATNAILSLGDTNQSVNVDAFKNLAQLWADWNDWRKNDESNPVWEALTEALSGETYDRFGELMDNVLAGGTFDQRGTTELLEQVMKEIGEYAEANTPEIPVQMTVPSDEAARLSELIGTVLINGQVVIGEDAEPHANGIWSVPRDNYLARLHKGERVVPARAVSSQNYNSNLYVESMYMNNGTDAAGLAAAMAAAQRRQMSGFGS